MARRVGHVVYVAVTDTSTITSHVVTSTWLAAISLYRTLDPSLLISGKVDSAEGCEGAAGEWDFVAVVGGRPI